MQVEQVYTTIRSLTAKKEAAEKKLTEKLKRCKEINQILKDRNKLNDEGQRLVVELDIRYKEARDIRIEIEEIKRKISSNHAFINKIKRGKSNAKTS